MDRRELLAERIQISEALLAHKLSNAVERFYSTESDRESYASHTEVFRAGARFRERCCLGANRCGKSTLGAFEVSLHLTGNYPDWWRGFNFERPTQIWACGETISAARDIVQEKLLGPPTAIGTGMIPASLIVDKRRKSGVPDAFDVIRVRHISGGISEVQFKSYQEKREGFQGRRIDVVWMDEEPSSPIYGECLLRTAATSKTEKPGRMLITCTPMKGMSEVVNNFLIDGRLAAQADKFACQIAWTDIPHLSEKEQAELLASIPKYQREARSQGIPSLGAGAVYTYREDSLLCEPLQHVPRYWLKGYGMDVGWRASAAVFVAQDPDSGMTYITNEYLKGEATPVENAANIKLKAETGWGPMTGAIDPASRAASQADGKRILDQYRDLGLKLFIANNAVESGIHTIQTLMDEGRLKIYSKCTGLFSELRRYARDENGKIQKRNDHLLDSLRYILATPKALGRPRPEGFKPKVLTGY